MATTKIALVTGSGKRRVGNTVAHSLATHGYDVALHYFQARAEAEQTVSELTREGLRAISVGADFHDDASVVRMVEEVIAHFDRIDLLVNCAGVWLPKPLEEVTAYDVRFHFEVNTLGTFLCSQQVGLAMVRQPEGGSIITVGDWAMDRPYVGYSAYFPSKGAIPTLTRCLAVELGTRNPKVRVNCILPGPVMYPPGIGSEERATIIDSTLVKREGTPEHVAQAVLFLAQNDFVTGACLTVDGGRSVFSPAEQ